MCTYGLEFNLEVWNIGKHSEFRLNFDQSVNKMYDAVQLDIF